MKNVVYRFILILLITSLGGQHTYAIGIEENPCQISFQIEIQDWDAVRQFLPKYSKFTVIDVESGKSFDVQRRAGSGHADVQPLTKKDTKIMKKIYGGRWSWKRRAVLILAKDSLIPASMHGMPHGAGALQNGFPGHFCIHFSGSTTHRTGKSDISHHLMILKASGKIDEYLNNLPPSELLNVFLAIIKNGDKGLAKKIAISNQKDINHELNKIEKIVAIRWSLPKQRKTVPYSLAANVPVDVNLFMNNIGAINTKLTFTLVRTSPLSPWKVNIDPLLSTVSMP
jgi:hypothetical protein